MYEPVPPDPEEENVTVFPTSVGFWELVIVTDGSGLTVSVSDADAVFPTASFRITSIVLLPEDVKEVEYDGP